MRLTIMQIGETPKALTARYARYVPQFQNMFARAKPAFIFEIVHVLDGDPFPSVGSLEGIILTGSAKGVYDTPDWMAPLRDFIRDAYAQKTPMLGVCFGHQIMAHALGGKVQKSTKGWGLGRQVYDVHTCNSDQGFMDGLPQQLAIAASHQDQVITPPPSAKVFLASEFTPNAGLVYENGAALSMQPHPEFSVDYARALVQLRLNDPLSQSEVAAADATLDAGVDNTLVADHLARFFVQAASA